jgi:hypothetical protein
MYADIMRGIIAGGVVLIVILQLILVVIGVWIANILGRAIGEGQDVTVKADVAVKSADSPELMEKFKGESN